MLRSKLKLSLFVFVGLNLFAGCGAEKKLSLDEQLTLLQSDPDRYTSEEAYEILRKGVAEKGLPNDALTSASVVVTYSAKTAPIKSLIELSGGVEDSTKELLKSDDLALKSFALGQVINAEISAAAKYSPELWELARVENAKSFYLQDLKVSVESRINQKHQKVLDELLGPESLRSNASKLIVSMRNNDFDGPRVRWKNDCSKRDKCKRDHSHAAGQLVAKQKRLLGEAAELSNLAWRKKDAIAALNQRILDSDPRLQDLLVLREGHMGRRDNALKNIEAMKFIISSVAAAREASISEEFRAIIEDIVQNVGRTTQLSEVLLLDLYYEAHGSKEKEQIQEIVKILQVMSLSGIDDDQDENVSDEELNILVEIKRAAVHLQRTAEYRDVALESIEHNLNQTLVMNEKTVEAAAVFLSETQLETDRLLGQKRDLQVQIAGIRDEMNSLNNQATALRDESNSCIPGIEHHNHYINHECNKIACERVIDDNF